MITKYICNIKLSIKEERVASASLKRQRKWKSKMTDAVETLNHHHDCKYLQPPLSTAQTGRRICKCFFVVKGTHKARATQTQNSDGAAVYYKRDQTLQFDDSDFCGSFYNSPKIGQNHLFFLTTLTLTLTLTYIE